MSNFEHYTQLLICAVHAQDAAAVEILIPLSYSMRHPHLNSALISAIKNNDVACAQLLAPAAQFVEITNMFPPNISNEMLAAVVPMCDSDDLNNYFIYIIQRGSVEQVTTIAQYCDCTDNNSMALQMAAVHRRDDLVEVLYSLSDGALALEELKKKRTPKAAYRYLEILVNNEKMRDILLEELSDMGVQKVRKM